MKPIKASLVTILLLAISVCVPVEGGVCSEIYFDFEHGNQGWRIPDWAVEQGDYVGEMVEVGREGPLHENLALKLMCDFPRQSWAAAIVEFETVKGIKGKRMISADVFLPGKARKRCLKARIIVTVGSGWWIMEGKAVDLKPGQWNRVAARFDELAPGEEMRADTGEGKSDRVVTSGDIRKIAIRIERDASQWNRVRRYKGSIYIDNVVVRP